MLKQATIMPPNSHAHDPLSLCECWYPTLTLFLRKIEGRKLFRQALCILTYSGSVKSRWSFKLSNHPNGTW